MTVDETENPSPEAIEAYQAQTQAVHDKYDERVLMLLDRWKDALRAASIPTDEPEDISSDDFEWSLVAMPAGLEKAGISIELAESLHHDGTTEGVNWQVTILEWGGRFLGQFAPHNYTPEVWVMPDSDEVAERFAMLESIDPAEVIEAVLKAEPPRAN